MSPAKERNCNHPKLGLISMHTWSMVYCIKTRRPSQNVFVVNLFVFKNVTLLIFNFIPVSKLIKIKNPIWCNVKFSFFVLFNAEKAGTKLALSKKKQYHVSAIPNLISDVHLLFRKLSCALPICNFLSIFKVRNLQTMADTGLPSVYSKSSIHMINWRKQDNIWMASRTPKHHRWAFTTNQCRCVWPKKILGSVGQKFFLFFVNFLYADFRAKLLLWA